jgi:hypothetical protein
MITNIDTVSEAFVEYLELQGYGTFGTDLFLSQVPPNAPDSTLWVITSGGSPIQKLATGETLKQYFISVFYRSTSAMDVEKKIFALEELLNCTQCVELTGFEVHEITAQNFGSDEDIDNEERRVGMLQANIKIYKKEC